LGKPQLVFNYTDYRKFLRDRIAEIKAVDKKFTYQFIADNAGFKSPGFVTQVLQGKSNLPDRFISGLTDLLQLKKREARYFELMVRYNQAKSHEKKKTFFEKMTVFKKGRRRTLDPDEFLFYDKWYYSAIRAVLNYRKFKGDYKKLAKTVVPAIKPAEAKKAVAVLEQLGLIVQNGNGNYKLTEKHVTTGLDTDSVVINNFVVNTLEIAKDALYTFPKEQRRLSALTLSVSEEGFRDIQKRIDEFRAELVERVKKDRGIDRVYQVNFQLFPLTDVNREKAR
jgi:uncharacterized protein (TIGR02147 family)